MVIFFIFFFTIFSNHETSKNVALPNHLHRAYVDVLYAEKLVNEATDVSQLEYVTAVLNQISLDEEEEVGKRNYGYRCSYSDECVSNFLCRKAHRQWSYSDKTPPKCKSLSLFRCRLNTWVGEDKGVDECTMEFMHPDYVEEQKDALKARQLKLLEESKKKEESESVPSLPMPVQLPAKRYYERCGSSSECVGVFICRKAHHAFRYLDKNPPRCQVLSFFRCRANTWRSPPWEIDEKVDECTIEFMKPQLSQQVEEARRFREGMLTQFLDVNAGEVAITDNINAVKDRLEDLALERQKETKWWKFAVKIFLKSAFIVLVGVMAASLFAAISFASLGTGAPLAAGVMLIGVDMMVAAGAKNAVCMAIDNFVDKGFEYLFEPPASEEEIALQRFVDRFVNDQTSFTDNVGHALKTAEKNSPWFWGAFKKGVALGLELIFPEGSQVVAVTTNLLEAAGKALLAIAEKNHKKNFWKHLDWFRRCIIRVTRPLWPVKAALATLKTIFLITQHGVALRDSQIKVVFTECLGLEVTVYAADSESRVGGGDEDGTGLVLGLSDEHAPPEEEQKPQCIIVDETPLEELRSLDSEVLAKPLTKEPPGQDDVVVHSEKSPTKI